MNVLTREALEHADTIMSPAMVEGVKRYVEHGIRPGEFLQSCFANDLINASMMADHINVRRLAQVGLWIATYCPNGSYGSWSAVRQWCDSFRESA